MQLQMRILIELLHTPFATSLTFSGSIFKSLFSSSAVASNPDSLSNFQIFKKNPTKIKNYGIWLRYQSRTGYHNMYKEYRQNLERCCGANVHRNGFSPQSQVPVHSDYQNRDYSAKLCKRESTKQFHNSKIKFPLVFRKVRPPSRKLKTTYKASKPNMFM